MRVLPDNEHSRQADYTGVNALAAEDKPPAATSNPFADLKSLTSGLVRPQFP